MLLAGKVVVVPMETVYGVLALPQKRSAMQTLGKLRPESAGKPLTLHISDSAIAEEFISPIGDLGQRMMRKLWPGPVALEFETSADELSQNVS